jgi:hypothetical protein
MTGNTSLIGKHKDSKRILPPKYGVFDCETEGLYGDARLICLMFPDGESETFVTDESGDCVDKFLDHILRRKYRSYKFFAHNVGFDISKTFGKRFGNMLDSKDFNVLMSGSRIIQAKYTFSNTNNKIYLLDSYNLIPQKLSEIGDDLGYEKFTTPKKWITGEKVTEITDEDIKYCLRDCEIILKILEVYREFLTPFNVGLKLTAAANAKAIWRAIQLKDNGIFVNETKDERFRESYHGGRTEVFVRGYREQKLFYYDVNSLYPFVMSENRFPNPDKLKYSKDLGKALKEHEGCAKIKIKPPSDIEYPILPFKGKDKTLFPAFEMTGVWNFPHIRLALEKGYEIQKVYWVLSSPPMDSPFAEFVSFFREKKIEYHNSGKKALRTLSKLMMNSLYGKFAQRNEIEDRYTHEEPPEGTIFKKLTDNTWSIGGIEKERAPETVVCWASYVTCYAQCLLYSFFPASGLHYCDTDSVVRDTELPPELVDKSEFGLMDLEYTLHESNFVAPKRYAFSGVDHASDEIKEKRVCKGVYMNTLKDVPIIAFDQDIGVFYDKPFKFKTALSKNVPVYSLEKVRKVLSINVVNDKRIFDKVGNSRPLQILPDG